jgi:hypothetical protein
MFVPKDSTFKMLPAADYVSIPVPQPTTSTTLPKYAPRIVQLELFLITMEAASVHVLPHSTPKTVHHLLGNVSRNAPTLNSETQQQEPVYPNVHQDILGTLQETPP